MVSRPAPGAVLRRTAPTTGDPRHLDRRPYLVGPVQVALLLHFLGTEHLARDCAPRVLHDTLCANEARPGALCGRIERGGGFRLVGVRK
jgi:hypothetical protein